MTDHLLQRILNQLLEEHNILCEHKRDIEGGFINRKWQVDIHQNPCIIKELSRKRYSIKRFKEVKKSLVVQSRFSEKYNSAPKLYVFNDDIIQYIDDDRYILMDYVDGEHKDVYSINESELYDLGRALANLHSMVVDDIYDFTFEDYYETFENHMTTVNHKSQDMNYLEVVRKIEAVKDQVSPDFLKALKVGFTHSDFSKDNIIFLKNKAQILDFDRGRIGYQLQDVGRAVISYAFDGETIDLMKLEQFISGYASVRTIARDDVVKALTLVWFIEVAWWVRENYFEDQVKNKIKEFRDEITWLTDNILNLDRLLKG